VKSTVLLEGHVTESLRSIKFNILRGVPMAGREVRRAVEKRAQALHESSDPSAIPWVKRGQAARDPRLWVTRQQMAQSENPSDSNERIGA